MALARALRQFDIETRILDKRNQHAEAGLAINLPGNAIQALERLGLKEQVDALGIPAPTINISIPLNCCSTMLQLNVDRKSTAI